MLISGGGGRSAGVTLLLLFQTCFLPRPATVATAALLPELCRDNLWRHLTLPATTAPAPVPQLVKLAVSSSELRRTTLTGAPAEAASNNAAATSSV